MRPNAAPSTADMPAIESGMLNPTILTSSAITSAPAAHQWVGTEKAPRATKKKISGRRLTKAVMGSDPLIAVIDGMKVSVSGMSMEQNLVVDQSCISTYLTSEFSQKPPRGTGHNVLYVNESSISYQRSRGAIFKPVAFPNAVLH